MGKNWGESFSDAFGDSFSKGMEMAMQAKRMKELKEMNQMHYDATLGSKGWARMDEDQAKEYMAYLAKKGVPVIGGGYAGLPEGAKLKNGEIIDSEGNNIGSYLEGYEPKKISNQIDQYPEGVMRVGSNFYKYNEDLAAKMGKSATTNLDLDKLQEELSGQGLQGNVTPSTIRVGNRTYRYNPSPEEKMGNIPTMQSPVRSPVQTMQEPAPMVGQPQVMQQPSFVNQQISNTAQAATLEKYRKAVQNAIDGGEKPEEIIKGLKEGGLNPKDFEDLLYAYEPSVPPLRRQILGNTLRNVGVAAPLNFMGSLSSSIDKIKNRMRNK